MQAWLRFEEWQKWCWYGGDFDSDYFDKDEPVIVVGLSEYQPFQNEVLYEIHQAYTAHIPFRFLSLEFVDNVI